MQYVNDCRMNFGFVIELSCKRTSPMVWSSTAAEGDSIIRSSLTLNDEVSKIGKSLVVVEAHLIPERFW